MSQNLTFHCLSPFPSYFPDRCPKTSSIVRKPGYSYDVDLRAAALVYCIFAANILHTSSTGKHLPVSAESTLQRSPCSRCKRPKIGPYDYIYCMVCYSMICLQGGSFPNEGHVDLYCNGQWRMICDNGFSSTDAQTTSKQLGYNNIITMALQSASLSSNNYSDNNV